MNQGIRKAQTLAVTLREGLDHLAPDRFEPAGLDDVSDSSAAVAALEPLELGSEFEIFLHPHVVVEGHIFGHVADFSTSFDGFSENIVPGDGGDARGGRQITGEHAQGCGLSGAIWAQKADDFALFDLEGDVAHRGMAGVTLCEVGDFDQGMVDLWIWAGRFRVT